MRMRFFCLLPLFLAACNGQPVEPPAATEEIVPGPPAPPYPNKVSAPIGAFITRLNRIHPDQFMTNFLFMGAENSASDLLTETMREFSAMDFMATGYLEPYMSEIGIKDTDWLSPPGDTTAGQYTPEEVSGIARQAFLLATQKRAMTPTNPWSTTWDATATRNHGMVMDNIPGLPQDWYGSDSIFAACSQASYLIGLDAGNKAFAAADPDLSDPKAVHMAAQAAVQAASDAAWNTVGNAVFQASLAEVQTLIAIH